MKEDLGSTEEARKTNKGHLSDIETFEKDIRLRLRAHLLTDRQAQTISTLQMPTLTELRAVLSGATGSSLAANGPPNPSSGG